MKKIVYPLVAALILCLVGIGMLLSARVGDRNELNRLQAQVALLEEQKEQWDAQKTQVSKSLSSVRGVLVKTLVDLEDVSASLGMAMEAMGESVPAEPSPAPKAATAPSEKELGTDAPATTAMKVPTATPSPSPSEGTASPTPTPGVKTSSSPVPTATVEATVKPSPVATKTP